MDHIVPRSKSGLTTIENLALQCPHCSLGKSNKTQTLDPETGRAVHLFHPLTDNWHEHFFMTVDGTIQGKTDIGRATVAALKMNDPWPRSSRALQIAVGWLTVG